MADREWDVETGDQKKPVDIEATSAAEGAARNVPPLSGSYTTLTERRRNEPGSRFVEYLIMSVVVVFFIATGPVTVPLLIIYWNIKNPYHQERVQARMNAEEMGLASYGDTINMTERELRKRALNGPQRVYRTQEQCRDEHLAQIRRGEEAAARHRARQQVPVRFASDNHFPPPKHYD